MAIKIIGITGPSGSGKSMLTTYAKSRSIPCIDADQVYHSLLIPPSKCLDALREAFGDACMNEDGSLNRSALSAIVFQSPQKLALLNQTVLPIVIDTINARIRDLEKSGEHWVVVDAPTLIESGFYRECDTVITVYAGEAERIRRIVLRDSITEERAQERVRAQKPLSFYTDVSDYSLENNSDRESFAKKCEALFDEILRTESYHE